MAFIKTNAGWINQSLIVSIWLTPVSEKNKKAAIYYTYCGAEGSDLVSYHDTNASAEDEIRNFIAGGKEAVQQ